jgi:hypothetical protein
MAPVHADPIDQDEAPLPTDALTLRRPDTPTTVSELAALAGGAIEIIEARVQVIATLRTASIRATHPEDWILFKSPDEHGGQVTGYLQDAGCDRVRDLWGIEVYAISHPEKITGTQPGIFHYLISGSGRCKLTQQVVEAIEGGRSSTDDFCRGKEGAELELLVRKAARANLDGNVTRELAGMKSVPVDELKAAWTGTTKRIEQCRRGRGFGSHDERLGGRSAKAPDVEPPKCNVCGATGVYRPGKDGRGAFFGCPNYQKHADRKWIQDAEKWVAQVEQMAAAKAVAATTPAKGPMPTAGEVFSGTRHPGEEG